ncbi:hypothetical protein N9L01_00475 [bacterium]|nr:hypothetical protein [bacterium]
MKYDDLDTDLQLDLEAAYDLMVNELTPDPDIKAGLDKILSTALPDSEVIDRQMIIEEIMMLTYKDDDNDEEPDALLSDFPDNMDMNMDEVEETTEEESDSTDDEEPDALLSDFPDNMDMNMDESDSDVLDRYLGDDSPDQLTEDEYNQLLDRNFDELEDEAEKAELVREIVALREGPSDEELEQMANDNEEANEEIDRLITQQMDQGTYTTLSYPDDSATDDDAILRDVLGADLLFSLQEAGYSIDVETINAKGALLFYDNDRATRIIHTIEDIISETDADGNMISRPILGDELSSTASIFTDSVDADIDLAKIINQISVSTLPDIEDARVRQRIRSHLDLLTRVQQAQNNLSDVFGFDDPRELEAFMSAWLMKNSTCRLSGIPGTGKTTVINSAAVVMANSYGFTTQSRFYPRTRSEVRKDVASGKETIIQIPDSSRPRFMFPQGMSYDVSFSARGSSDTLSAWDAWRFTDWDSDHYSGAYAYDFAFLREVNKVAPLDADDFVRILFMHHRPVVASATDKGVSSARVSDLINAMSIPIEITIKSDGKIDFSQPKGGNYDGIDYTYEVSIPNGLSLIKSTLQPIASKLAMMGDEGSLVLRTDTGFAEGKMLRQVLMDHFYDSRVSKRDNEYSGDNLESLRSEMLREIGIAKIDNDKRADEILYGMEIQQIREDKEGREVQTFVFDPIPRPIVTQPIKFFNEANRSQSGVEDAVLGLIAEREVEYRGKTFNSPAFVAWMDTNPHQKANDLAFTDRIDTELFFGTISLGARNAQLQTRYAGAKNAKPDIQLITRIIESKIDRPIRIKSLGLGRKSVWSFIDSIPFRPPEVTSGYDGLRDIATLSVLFTQRPQLRAAPAGGTGPGGADFQISYNVEQKDFLDYDSDNPHASPLEDISRASVTDIIEGMDTARQIHGEGAEFQPQSRIKRVLGFRFTDSIVKMSRALAFLRGKTYVGRREIVDSLPYCLGHRLGRARAEGDQEPTGIEQTAVGSEQSYVRQILVHGYLLNDTGGAGGSSTAASGPTEAIGAFEMWDAYFSFCEQSLASSPSYTQFERDVLKPLQVQFMTDSERLTTVHWHLATSVVEAERTGISNMHPTHYTMVCTNGRLTEGDYNYPDVLAHYRKLISRPEKPNDADTPVAMTFNFAAADYFKVRGLISSDRFLFSDDRAHLLDLVDSRIDSLCGRDTEVGTISSDVAVASFNNTYDGLDPYDEGAIVPIPYGINPMTFPWRSYGDSAGAWGVMLGTALPFNPSGSGNATRDLDLGATSRFLLYSMADQSHRIAMQAYESDSRFGNDDKRQRASEQEYRFRKHQAPAIREQFGDYVSTGVMFNWSSNSQSAINVSEAGSATPDPGISVAIPETGYAKWMIDRGVRANSPLTLDNVMDSWDALIHNRMSGSGAARNDAIARLSGEGIMACFPLNHAPGVIDRAASSGAVPTIFDMISVEGSENPVDTRFGNLRLWLRLHEEDNANEGQTTLIFTMGITSNLARVSTVTGEETVLDDGTIVAGEEKQILEYLDITDLDAYTRTSYTGVDSTIIDSGNLTAEDVVTFDRLFSKALNSRAD